MRQKQFNSKQSLHEILGTIFTNSFNGKLSAIKTIKQDSNYAFSFNWVIGDSEKLKQSVRPNKQIYAKESLDMCKSHIATYYSTYLLTFRVTKYNLLKLDEKRTQVEY